MMVVEAIVVASAGRVDGSNFFLGQIGEGVNGSIALNASGFAGSRDSGHSPSFALIGGHEVSRG